LQNLQNLKEQTRYPGAWAISLVACFAMISNTLCQVTAQLYTPQNPSVRDGHPNFEAFFRFLAAKRSSRPTFVTIRPTFVTIEHFWEMTGGMMT